MKINYILIQLLILFLFSCNQQVNENKDYKKFSLTSREKQRLDSLFIKYKIVYSIDDILFKKYDRAVNIIKKDTIKTQSFIVVEMQNKNGDVIGKELELKNMTKKISNILHERLKDSTNYVGVISEIKVKRGGFIIQKEGIMKVGINFKN